MEPYYTTAESRERLDSVQWRVIAQRRREARSGSKQREMLERGEVVGRQRVRRRGKEISSLLLALTSVWLTEARGENQKESIHKSTRVHIVS